ncbi:MAG: hypothetical protein LCH54_11030 [Bacteroidetes bacterium]|nr:hypothetical protein [Bacteroidota bacterium]
MQFEFTAWVLVYRVPGKPDQALMDRQRAISMVRGIARKEDSQVGILVFSAKLVEEVTMNLWAGGFRFLDILTPG